MAEAGLQAQDIPAPPVPQAPQLPIQLAQQTSLLVNLNWSHFKPEFSGKPDEDGEAHFLRTNDWMSTHYLWEGIKVQRFCLTLVWRG